MSERADDAVRTYSLGMRRAWGSASPCSLVAITAAHGFAIASMGRNTAAARGVGFACFLVLENVVGSFLAGFRRWLLLGNAIVLVSGEDDGGEVVGRRVVQAGLYLTLIAVALMAVGTTLSRRRDVA